jgi:hypothetical protein
VLGIPQGQYVQASMMVPGKEGQAGPPPYTGSHQPGYQASGYQDTRPDMMTDIFCIVLAVIGFPCTLCCVIPYFLDENRHKR